MCDTDINLPTHTHVRLIWMRMRKSVCKCKCKYHCKCNGIIVAHANRVNFLQPCNSTTSPRCDHQTMGTLGNQVSPQQVRGSHTHSSRNKSRRCTSHCRPSVQSATLHVKWVAWLHNDANTVLHRRTLSTLSTFLLRSQWQVTYFKCCCRQVTTPSVAHAANIARVALAFDGFEADVLELLLQTTRGSNWHWQWRWL